MGRVPLHLMPQVGRDNPAELKAQKLARGLQRGVLDRDLKPNSEERRKLQVGTHPLPMLPVPLTHLLLPHTLPPVTLCPQSPITVSLLQAILKLPPNKPLHADDRALLWRFRASLTSDTRALTKFLKCVDWGDALEAKQVGEGRLQAKQGWCVPDACLPAHHSSTSLSLSFASASSLVPARCSSTPWNTRPDSTPRLPS